MTPQMALAEVATLNAPIIIHRGQVFFNTRDPEEMQRWQARGARCVPHFTGEEVASRAARGQDSYDAWEVHILGTLNRVSAINEDGDEVDVTNDLLLAAARA